MATCGREPAARHIDPGRILSTFATGQILNGGDAEYSTGPPRVRPGHSGAGYFARKVRHVVLAAVWVVVPAIVTRRR